MSNQKLKKYQCKSCNGEVLFLDNKGLCVNCEDIWCGTCGKPTTKEELTAGTCQACHDFYEEKANE